MKPKAKRMKPWRGWALVDKDGIRVSSVHLAPYGLRAIVRRDLGDMVARVEVREVVRKKAVRK